MRLSVFVVGNTERGFALDTRHVPQVAKDAMEQFPLVFTSETSYVSSPGVAWAPGRINLIGEHTDYNDGFVLPLAVDRRAVFAGRTRSDAVVCLWSTHFKEMAQFVLDGLPQTFEQQRATLPGWARYILGVATELVRAGATVSGFDAVVGGDVPLGGGMSSSAALEVAAAQAFALFSRGTLVIGEEEASMTPMQVAALCQRAEQVASGVRCGILDQAASCLGRAGKAVVLDCRSLEFRYVPFEVSDLSLVVMDTGVRRELAASAYNERRRQCEEATQYLRDLMRQQEPERQHEIIALRDVSPEQFERFKHYLPDILRRRAGYVIAENQRVLQVAALLDAGTVEAVGPILFQGHAGLRDEYEVSCQELDTLVDIAQQIPGVLGARMVGGGFGGCTINLVRNEAIGPLRVAVEELYPARTGRQASIAICHAAEGPGHAWL